MARPDWDALQKRFLSDHAKTGISPKAWCEQQGLNYTSARRYIKKPAQDDAQSAQEDVRSAQNAQNPDGESPARTEGVQVNHDVAQESDGLLRPQHESFAQNIAQGMTQKEAAICAGYSPTRAEAQASTLMRRPDVRARIQELRKEAALLVSFNAKHLADLSYQAAKEALDGGKFGQVAPNIKNAAQLTGIDMTNKTEVNVELAGLSYGKVCIVTPATCTPEVWQAHMAKLAAGKPTAQQ